MPSSKRLEFKAPQISISSWLMGGPIVTQPRRGPPRRVLVTTEPAKVPVSPPPTPFLAAPAPPFLTTNVTQKKAAAAKPNGEKEDSSSNKPEAPKPEEAPKPAEEPQPAAASKDTTIVTEKLDGDWTWTADQDAQLQKLKNENVSWKEIARRMSLAKSDIQVRFKELLKKNAAETQQKDAAETQKKDAAETVTVNTVDNGKEDNSMEKDSETDGDEEVQVHEQEGEGAGGGRGGGCGGRQGCVKCGGRLRPDDNWSREDCEMLEMLEARYREEKWLSLQASFYNFTGRMIRADIIERKLSEPRS